MEKKQTSVHIPREMIKQIKYLAIDSNKSFNDIIVEAIEEKLKKEEENDE